jgi:hypothetical protein
LVSQRLKTSIYEKFQNCFLRNTGLHFQNNKFDVMESENLTGLCRSIDIYVGGVLKEARQFLTMEHVQCGAPMLGSVVCFAVFYCVVQCWVVLSP